MLTIEYEEAICFGLAGGRRASVHRWREFHENARRKYSYQIITERDGVRHDETATSLRAAMRIYRKALAV